MVALSIVLPSAARTMSAATSRTRSSEVRKSTRSRSAAPTTASSVLPTAMPQAIGSGAFVMALATSAPSVTPGQ